MKQTLPTGKWNNGRLEIGSPYDPDGYITCEIVGQMQSGEMVWEDESGKQYTRNRIHGKYYFIEL